MVFEQNSNYEKAQEFYFKAARNKNNRKAQEALTRVKEKLKDNKVQYSIGNKYYKKQEYKKAFEWLEKSSQQDNSKAQNLLGKLYENGFEIEKDYEKSYEWYSKSANQGNEEAQKSAIKVLKELAQQGNPNYQYELGKLYENGFGIEKDYEKSYEWYSKSAKQGNKEAEKSSIEVLKTLALQGESKYQYELGTMYENGFEVEKDYEKAYEWYSKSANQGNEEAQKSAIKILKELAQQGLTDYQYELGMLYENGLMLKAFVIEVDYETAYVLYKESAKQGNKEAEEALKRIEKKLEDKNVQYDIGIKYCQKEEYKKAFEWLEKSAKQGEPNAQYGLGTMYENGFGVEKDYEKAYEWYSKSAVKGNKEAIKSSIKVLKELAQQGKSNYQYELGKLYEKGSRVGNIEKDYEKTYEWYSKSAKQGNKEAEEALKRIEEKLEDKNIEYEIGIKYYNKQEYKKAFEWLEKSAKQGNAEAQNLLGIMYEKGFGVKLDYEKAHMWYSKSIKSGNKKTENNLTYMIKKLVLNKQNDKNLQYIIGDYFYINKEYKISYSWLKKSAKQGHSLAQELLVENLKILAEQGDSNAQFDLGKTYYYGDRVDSDYDKAISWLKKSAEQGNTAAKSQLQKSTKKDFDGIQKKKMDEWGKL